jgi:hypothetical protein
VTHAGLDHMVGEALHPALEWRQALGQCRFLRGVGGGAVDLLDKAVVGNENA